MKLLISELLNPWKSLCVVVELPSLSSICLPFVRASQGKRARPSTLTIRKGKKIVIIRYEIDQFISPSYCKKN
jgi:hypothetical protein